LLLHFFIARLTAEAPHSRPPQKRRSGNTVSADPVATTSAADVETNTRPGRLPPTRHNLKTISYNLFTTMGGRFYKLPQHAMTKAYDIMQ
jgi:hypothetical protein